MHQYSRLAVVVAEHSLQAIDRTTEQAIVELQSSAEARLVVGLQAMRLQLAVTAVGMFAMFDAELQRALHCADGFAEAERQLERLGETQLLVRFTDLRLAVNVLKHGAGRSFDTLSKRAALLPFAISDPLAAPTAEGDVSGVELLIDVDSAFVRLCALTIEQVSRALERCRPS